MHDFDRDREQRHSADRQFKIGGEVFTRRPAVRPEAMTAYEDLTPGASASEAVEVIDNLILAFLEPSDHERYRALREREEDPLNVTDLNDLVRWLIIETTRRPTQQPSPSTAGSEPTGIRSMENSSSEQDAASAA
jgi:hypothetical protein